MHNNQIRRYPVRRVLIAVLLTATISSCATHVHYAPTLSESSPAPDGTGIVLARIVNASAQPLPYNYLTVAAKDVNESQEAKPYRLTAIGDVVGSSTLFAAHVPAGQYSVTSLRAYYSQGEYYLSRWVSSDATSGTFDISPGGVTDLGTIVYYPKVQGDRMINVLGRSPTSENSELVAAHLAFVDQDMTGADRWNEEDIEEDKISLYISMLQNPLVYHDRLKAPDNSIYFVGKLGSILQRDAAGEWHLDAVDTDSDLTAIAQNALGDMAVGGSFGSFFLKRKGGEWRSGQLAKNLHVGAIRFHDDVYVDVVVHTYGVLTIQRAKVNEDPLNWQTLASYRLNHGWFDGDGNHYIASGFARSSSQQRIISGVSLETINDIDYLFVDYQRQSKYSPLASSERNAFTFDPASWRIAESTGVGDDVDAVIDAGVLTLGLKRPGFFSLTQENKFYRFDPSDNAWAKISTEVDRCPSLGDAKGDYCKFKGEVFKRRPRFSFASAPVFTSSTEAIAFVRFKKDASRDSEKHTALAETHDGGQTWQVTDRSLPSEYCTDTVPEAEGVLLVYCRGISSDFYESYDKGKTWKHVKEHQDF